MQYKTIKLKRLWNNIASTRDYIINDCLNNHMGIRFELAESSDYMLLSFDDLKSKAFQINTKLQKSRYSKDYYLVDFAWRPTIERSEAVEEPAPLTLF